MKIKDIPGYEGRYAITERGDVFSHISQRRLVSSLNKSSGYLTVNLRKDGKQRLYRISQLVLLAFRGKRPTGLVGDHKDTVKTNDDLRNLRYVTHGINMHNFKRKSKHGFRGISLHAGDLKNPWRAQIQYGKKRWISGYLSSPKEAAMAYDVKALEFFGVEAMTNKSLGFL